MSLTFSQWMQLQNSHKVYMAEIELIAPDGSYHIVRFGSEPIVLGGEYFDGRIVAGAIPTFSRSIKNIGGQAQVSYGSMTLANGDRELDTLLENYTWVGANVMVRYGGKEIDYAEYPTVVNAYIRDITITDDKIELSLSDKMLSFLRTKPAATTWNGTKLYTMVDNILNACGIDSTHRDSAL